MTKITRATRNSKTRGKDGVSSNAARQIAPSPRRNRKAAVTDLSIIICVRATTDAQIIDRTLYASFFCGERNGTEVIVVDSSTEDTAKSAIKDSVTSFGGTYIANTDNTRTYSLAQARNIGAAAARGGYLLFADIDLIAPNGFIELLHRFIKNGRLSQAENFFSIIPVVYLGSLSPAMTITELRSTSLQDLLYGPVNENVNEIQMVNSTILIHKSFYTLLGGQHEGFRGWGMEDWHFLWKLMSFPQPFPGAAKSTQFHRKSANETLTPDNWRDTAWLIGNEALQHGLYLFHIPHEKRAWRSSLVSNEKRFDALVHNNIVLENNGRLKTGQPYRVYSDDPSIANALLYPPESPISVSKASDIVGHFQTLRKRSDAGRPVIGAIEPDRVFYEAFGKLQSGSYEFDFIYPTGSPGTSFYFSCQNGGIIPPKPVDNPNSRAASHAEFPETAAINATTFRRSQWRNGKILPLFILTEDIQEPKYEANTSQVLFGMPPVKFRSLVNALLPLLSNEKVAMVFDRLSLGNGQTFSSDNAHDVSGESLALLIHASDMVITQSPRYALQAALAGKPVITTGNLFERLLPSLPISQQLHEIYDFIEDPDARQASISQDEIEIALQSACLSVADDRGAPTPTDLLKDSGNMRVLYEQVARPEACSNFAFSNQLTNPGLYAWLYPHINSKNADALHLQIRDNPYVRLDRSALKMRQSKAGDQAPRKTSANGSFQSNFPANASERRVMYRSAPNGTRLRRKLAKLWRSPRQFFDDSSNPALRAFRFLFPKP